MHNVQLDVEEILGELQSLSGIRNAVLAVRSGEIACLGRTDLPPAGIEDLGKTALWVLDLGDGEEDYVLVDYGGRQLGVYRVGLEAGLAAFVEGSLAEAELRELWRTRRSDWSRQLRDAAERPTELEASATDRELFGEPVGVSTSTPAPAPAPAPSLKPEVEATPATRSHGGIEALLREAAICFASFRAQQDMTGIEARREFDALVREWESFCDPDIYSFPMLLDSLSQSFGSSTQVRGQFLGKMQSIMSRYLG